MGMIDFQIFIQAGGKKEQFKGKVIGFSSRLNTILVPQAFMDWSNQEFAPNNHSDPTRLIVEVEILRMRISVNISIIMVMRWKRISWMLRRLPISSV